MNTVFVAGSITIRALADEVRERLDNIVRKQLHVLVGDAQGADTAIQRHLHDAGARAVTVYCSSTTAKRGGETSTNWVRGKG